MSYPGQAIDIQLHADVTDIAETLSIRIEVVDARVDAGIVRRFAVCVCVHVDF